MKRKLNIVFLLMALALLGIIIFQIYWTANAYKVNKEKFDITVNTAMQKAMDDCKKNYFDSIRRFVVKRLSPPATAIRFDTLATMSIGVTQTYDVFFLQKNTLPSAPYTTSKTKLDFYRKKIDHVATMPEVLTEMAFYEPILMRQIMDFFIAVDNGFTMFTMGDIRNYPQIFNTFSKGKTSKSPNPIVAFAVKFKAHDSLVNHQSTYYQHVRDSAIKNYLKSDGLVRMGKISSQSKAPNKHAPAGAQLQGNTPASVKKNGASPPTQTSPAVVHHHYKTPDVYQNPPNYRKADSLMLYRYFKQELEKTGIYSPFTLVVTTKSSPAAPMNLHYTETEEDEYKYHGFKIFGVGEGDLFMRAKFEKPQYGVLRIMLVTLVLSALLIVFTVFCFNYIFKTFIEQKKLADLKDDFINNMTHELKTPIAIITVAIEGLQKFNALEDTEKTQRYLQTSRNELARLNDLVTKVLDIATFENKDIELAKQPINIDSLAEDVIQTERAKTSKHVNISYTNKDSLELIYADRLHFRNVLVNLVDNAIKYTREPVVINITCQLMADNVVFSVKDNGIGIPASHLHQVFDKFHRVPTGNLHLVKGTGLGLSYVKYIVEAHGGTITVKSEINKGSEFTVSIPLNNG